MKTDIIILASGFSRRLGRNKLFLPYQGTTLLEHLLQKVCRLPYHRILIVTQYPEVQSLAQKYPVEIIENHQAQEGQAASIRQGIAHSEADAALLLVADQPHIKAETLQRMLALNDGQHIVCAACEGRYRNPALFPRKYYRDLKQLHGEQGGKQVLYAYQKEILAIPCEKAELRDIDTQEDISS